MQERLSFDFPAKLEHVLEVRRAVHKLCIDLGFSRNEADMFVTAVWEATLNAATHGSPRGEADHVKVKVGTDDHTLLVDITSNDGTFRLPDRRPEFDPTTKRGRGLPMVYAIADSVSLTPHDHSVTLHIAKHLPTAAHQ